MSANRNSLPRTCTLVLAVTRRFSGCLFPMSRIGPTETHRSPIPASRLPASHPRREPRRWLYVSPESTGESQLRFAVPACIALQGGERASTVAIIHDPQCFTSRLTRPNCLTVIALSLPYARRERIRDMFGQRHPAVWPSDQPFDLKLSYLSCATTRSRRRSCGTF